MPFPRVLPVVSLSGKFRRTARPAPPSTAHTGPGSRRQSGVFVWPPWLFWVQSLGQKKISLYKVHSSLAPSTGRRLRLLLQVPRPPALQGLQQDQCPSCAGPAWPLRPALQPAALAPTDPRRSSQSSPTGVKDSQQTPLWGSSFYSAPGKPPICPPFRPPRWLVVLGPGHTSGPRAGLVGGTVWSAGTCSGPSCAQAFLRPGGGRRGSRRLWRSGQQRFSDQRDPGRLPGFGEFMKES